MTEDLSILTRTAKPPDLSLAYGCEPDQIADARVGLDGANRPLLVLIHGGFWKPEYDRAHAEAMSSALAEAGWTVLTLEYRRIPAQPEATLADVSAALESLPAQLTQHNGKILLLGHSAGGHLALWLAAQHAQAKLNAQLHGVIALAPAADLCFAHALNLGDGAVKKFLGTEPLEYPDADTMRLPAPTIAVTLVHGEADQIVPLGIAHSYCAAFPASHLVTVPDSGHFALIDPQSQAWLAVVDAICTLSKC